MRTHPGKCHLLLSSKTHQVLCISGKIIPSSTAETLVGIIIDSELNFENHLNSICNKMSRKINAFDPVTNTCMPLTKCSVLMKIFTEPHFNCCPLIWMLHLKNISIIKLTVSIKRASRIIYSDYISSFEGLLNKDFFNSRKKYSKFSHRNLKFLNGLSPGFLNNLFHKNSSNKCALRNRQELYSRNQLCFEKATPR